MIGIDLSGRVALVTDSSRGISRAATLLLAQTRADITVNHRDNRQAGELTASMIREMGCQALDVNGGLFIG